MITSKDIYLDVVEAETLPNLPSYRWFILEHTGYLIIHTRNEESDSS